MLAARAGVSQQLSGSWPNRKSITGHLGLSLQISPDGAADEEPEQVAS